MKIKHTFTLFCVTLTLAFLLVSCADSSEGSNETADNQSNLDYQSNLAWINSITVADVSKENCEHADLSLNCFISVWNTENSGGGASATNTIVLPLVSGGTYDFYVDWGDESEVEYITNYSDATHTYSNVGEQTIYIAGTIKGWRFYVEYLKHGDAAKLLNVTQWGSLSLGNTAGSQFYGAQNFNPTATDAPDVSETTSLIAAFNSASSFNADISDWDVGEVTDMNSMFFNARSFNNNGKPLDWGDKTSKVTDMSYMFNFASAFNQDINDWDVRQVTNMGFMFWSASSFNNNGKPLDWGDKTSNVTDMKGMFNGASVFNQNISGWKVENVEHYDNFATGSGLELNNIPFKFREIDTISKAICDANPLTNCFISVWNTANSGGGASDGSTIVLPLVNNGEYNFYVDWGDGSVQQIKEYDAPAVTHNYDESGTYTIHIAGTIKGWRFFVSETNDLSGGVNDFGDAAKLTGVTQWGSLSLGNTAGKQFQGAQNFNPTATDAPDLSETTSLVAAFNGASSFNADISDWDVENVTSMAYMFFNANKFNNNGMVLDWGAKTSKVTDMQWMFLSAGVFNQDISAWDVGEVTSMKGMFGGAKAFNQDISDWNVSQVTDMNSMFNTAGSFNNNGKPLDWGKKTSKVTNMQWMFFGSGVFNQDISAWNVEKVTDMAYMFSGASSFNNAGMSLEWGDKTSNVTSMNSMFNGASVFNQDISGWNVSAVTDMTTMFWGASVFNQDICYWNVGNVTQSASQDFAKDSALDNKNNPFKAECTARKSN